MLIYRVNFTNSDRTQFEHMVSDAPQVIGRSTRADIVLSEDSVSRQHAKLYVDGGVLFIEDLGSSNGVIVNSERVVKRPLSDSDIVQIGCYTMRAELLDDTALQKFVRRTEIEYRDVAPIHEKLVETDHSSVPFLYRVSQCLCRYRQLAPLLEGVLDAVMAHVPAERGLVLTRQDPNDPLKLNISKSRLDPETDPPVSHTLIDHVLQSRSSVLTTDASQDERFEGSESIAAFQIKAVICVPLTGSDGVYGVIYVNSDSVPVPLTEKHLQLLSIVGQMVGAGIENIALANRQIRQERMAGIGETVSATSHDMRNILTGISGGTELIEIACEDEKWTQAKTGVRIVRKSLDRFRALVDSLLTYARIAELNLESADLGILVYDVLGTVESEARKRRITMHFDHRAPGNVLLDTQQMYRVLLNLVSNAMDAMDDGGGTINIESGHEGGSTFVRVRDSGRGIPPELLKKIGQPFFSTKEEKGTGLGLAICYRIMEQHRGTIDVDSAPNQGTTFTLMFPPDYTQTRLDNNVSS